MGENQKVEEAFRELLLLRIFQANSYARVALNPSQLGHSVWTIIGVFPDPAVIPANGQPNTQPDPATSLYRNDLSFDSSEHSAKRLSREQWEAAKRNPFLPGNTILSQNGMLEYGYINFMDMSSSAYAPGGAEIEVRPRAKVAGKLIGISYLRVHPEITSINDNVLLPESMEGLLVDKIWNHMSWNQGDGTTSYTVTQRDIAELSASVL